MIGVGLLYLVNYPDEDIRVDAWLGSGECLSESQKFGALLNATLVY